MGIFETIKEMTGYSQDTLGTKISLEEKFNQRERTLKFTIAALVAAIGFIGIALMNAEKEKYASIEIPGTIYAATPIKVGNGWTNDMMLKVWGDWLINTTANVNPADVKEKLNEGLRVFSQEKMSLYASQLGALSNTVLRNQMKQVFAIKKTNATYYGDTDFKNVVTEEDKIKSAVFEYQGVATQTLNNGLLPDRSCTYKVSFVFDGGHLYCNTYDTDCFK